MENHLKDIEFWENHYLNQIEFTLRQDLDKMLEGLKSKDKIREDWIDAFERSADKNSDFARGAERIYFWLFDTFGIPNSSPIGSDMFFETYNAFVHIDIKTAKLDNHTDYKGRIPVGSNQTSYKSQIHTFEINLPNKYKFQNKVCLTYFINIVYEIVENNIEIKAILLISVPNGELHSVYGEDVIGAGKSGYEGKGFRYIFEIGYLYRLLDSKPSRIRMIYANPDTNEFKNSIIGFDFFN